MQGGWVCNSSTLHVHAGWMGISVTGIILLGQPLSIPKHMHMENNEIEVPLIGLFLKVE